MSETIDDLLKLRASKEYRKRMAAALRKLERQMLEAAFGKPPPRSKR